MLHCKLISEGSETLTQGSYLTSSRNFGSEFSSLTLRIFSTQIIDLMLDTYSPQETFNDWIDFAAKILDCDTDGVVSFLKKAAAENSTKYTKLKDFLQVLDNNSLLNAISNHTIYAIEPYLLETLLEKIRDQEFQDRPSRLESELAFSSIKDAKQYLGFIQGMTTDTEVLSLHEIDTKDCTRIFEVDQNHLNKIDFSDPIHVVIGCIHGYWSGVQTDSPLKEVILQGQLYIKGKLAI